MEIMQSVLHLSATALGSDGSYGGGGCGGVGGNSINSSSSVGSQNLYFVVSTTEEHNTVNAQITTNDINICPDLERPWMSNLQCSEGTFQHHVPGQRGLFFMEKIRG
jgi:hypothetical protein